MGSVIARRPVVTCDRTGNSLWLFSFIVFYPFSIFFCFSYFIFLKAFFSFFCLFFLFFFFLVFFFLFFYHFLFFSSSSSSLLLRIFNEETGLEECRILYFFTGALKEYSPLHSFPFLFESDLFTLAFSRSVPVPAQKCLSRRFLPKTSLILQRSLSFLLLRTHKRALRF